MGAGLQATENKQRDTVADVLFHSTKTGSVQFPIVALPPMEIRLHGLLIVSGASKFVEVVGSNPMVPLLGTLATASGRV